MKLVKEHINEKFTEDSDPIADLGIGFIKFLKEERDKAGKRTSDESSRIYYGTSKYHHDSLIVFHFLDLLYHYIQLKDRTADFDYNKALKVSLEQVLADAERWEYNDINIARIFYALKKFYHIDLQAIQIPYWKKDVNEKFIEDSDPIHDLGIGLYVLLKKEFEILTSKDDVYEMARYLFNDDRFITATFCIVDILKSAIRFHAADEADMQKLYIEKTKYYHLTDYGYKIIEQYFKTKFNLNLSR